MATHYPHIGANENKQGLHYSRFSVVILKPGTDSYGKNILLSAKSRPNPRSWARIQRMANPPGIRADR
jgi:hypothetical protein